ncbi:hypothetical protein [Salinispora oceanensis]|uniref:hypothetical protein n=1 Tax=Salinispora oceanensis TaxID=1050199 RepID=UPI000488ACF3|nr:hypothetical protein [Salinispora oceanensis]
MPLVFHKNYRKVGPFRQAHPGVEVQGDGFFDDVSKEQLQGIIDQTNNSLKRRVLEFDDPDPARADRYKAMAAALLKAADSRGEGPAIEVVWGIHQEVTAEARGGGRKAFKHFTVRDPSGRQWHLYVDDRVRTITYLTPKRSVAVKVANV